MLVKFEQNSMVETTLIFELFEKKTKEKQKRKNKNKKKTKQKNGVFKTIFDKALMAFWNILEDVSVAILKQLFSAKMLISRLQSFSVPKITVV